MNSLKALEQLRNDRGKQGEKAALVNEVRSQMRIIDDLKKQHGRLKLLFESLCQGKQPEPEEAEKYPHIAHKKSVLRSVEEKLSCYRLIGPCGVTVTHVDTELLEVTFHPRWLELNETFDLKITSKDNRYELLSTNLPYFIPVQQMLNQSAQPDWINMIDAIGHKLSAHVQKKAEMLACLDKHREQIKRCSSNEPVTFVEIELVSSETTGGGPEKSLLLTLTYSEPGDLYPFQVDLESETISLSQDLRADLEHSLLTSPLSSVLPIAISGLSSAALLLSATDSDGC